MIARDGANTSLWQEVDPFPVAEKINADMIFDVLVIGGGITGLSTALALQKKGKKCVLAEAWQLAFGTTGGTTAHLNNFFDTPYYKVSKDFGKDNALLLARGASDAMEMIRRTIGEFGINCGYSIRHGFLFATDEEQVAELERVVTGMQKAGINMEYINESPFPIPYLKIAQIPDQAQFHPVQYLHGLARAFESLGGVILEQHKIDKLEHDDNLVIAHSEAGVLNARYAVYATHTAPGVNMIHFRCAPYRSYVLAFKLRNNNYPEALGYDLGDPYHYYRTQQINGEPYLIAGGEDHKTGHEENTELPFRKLESYARKYFDIEAVTHHWSSQYYESVDGLPFIGHLPGNPANVFVATAFGGNGMIYGTIAGQVLSDLITEGTSVYSSLFNPARIKPATGLHNFIKENADVVKEFITGKFSSEKINEMASVAPGEGKLVRYEGMQVALFKDESHNIHAINPTCTHVHCTVAWNQAERSWDCPCHGARFSADGKVLNGPAGKDLNKIRLSGG